MTGRRSSGRSGRGCLQGLAFLATNPFFFSVLVSVPLEERGRPPSVPQDVSLLELALRRTAEALIDLGLPSPVSQAAASASLSSWLLMLPVAFAALAVLVWHLHRGSPREGEGGLRRHPERLGPIALLLVPLSAMIALYFLQRSPPHAMGARYMLLISPPLYAAAGQGLARLRCSSRSAELALVVLLFGVHLAFTVPPLLRGALQAPPAPPPHEQGVPLLLDTTRGSEVPAVLWRGAPRGLRSTRLHSAPSQIRSPPFPPTGTPWSTSAP